LIRNELQLHTIASVHMHATALQFVSESTVDDKLLRLICGRLIATE